MKNSRYTGSFIRKILFSFSKIIVFFQNYLKNYCELILKKIKGGSNEED